ncbi:MAG: helix-turn-helix domain-containing protein [Dehalococcoidia bacterium]
MVYLRDEGLCGICESSVIEQEAVIDHVIPLARGGDDEPTNWQIAHPRCNSRKADCLPSELPSIEARVGWGSSHPISAWRLARGLTQRQLADLIGVQPVQISRWENDKNKPAGRLLDLALEGLDQRLRRRRTPKGGVLA